MVSRNQNVMVDKISKSSSYKDWQNTLFFKFFDKIWGKLFSNNANKFSVNRRRA